MRVALIGYGNVGRAFADLLARKQGSYPFRIVAIQTARHGSAFDDHGLRLEPEFEPAPLSIEEFLERARAEVAIEITTLKPADGEPATGHIRAALRRGIHVITANKGPIAHAYSQLREEARRAQVDFRFESTVMDGAPVFNTVRNNLPGVRILGFTGVLNSTTKIVVDAMSRGMSMSDGIAEARRLGIAEADASYDIDGWDSAAKTAALANVLMDAGMTPQQVTREGIGELTTARAVELDEAGRTILLVSRAERVDGATRLQVRPEVVEKTDMLATITGSSNLLLFHTDEMGTLGTVSINPGVAQTAYGLFTDLVDIARHL